MKEGQKLWTRDELSLAINLYSKLTFGRLNATTPDVKNLAKVLERTPSSVALKLVNLASLDIVQKKRGIKGMANASKLDQEVWNEFQHNWDQAFLESETLLANKLHTSIEELNAIDISDLNKEGLDKERVVKTRVNQCLFRKMLLTAYNSKCCITGIDNPNLLIAAHISPWAGNQKNRLNPSNGLLLNALHDKAFEHYLITITEDYIIKVSSLLKKQDSPQSIHKNFLELEGNSIILPQKFLPSKEFLKRHNEKFEQG